MYVTSKEESQFGIGWINLKRSRTLDNYSHHRFKRDWFRVYWIWGYHLYNIDDRIRKNQTQRD